jgi:hypothetical protein
MTDTSELKLSVSSAAMASGALVRGRMPKLISWTIYAAGFVIWLFGYLSAGHATLFDWNAVTPWWISSFIPNREAELGLMLMFASIILIYWPAGRKRA